LQVVANVRLLSFSLLKRIQPRYFFGQQHGVQLSRTMVKATDARFARTLGVELAEYETFKAAHLADAAAPG